MVEEPIKKYFSELGKKSWANNTKGLDKESISEIMRNKGKKGIEARRANKVKKEENAKKESK